uniref:Uncharacterized protein n=2 Tax=viral metagenome TaxID=1070528 RepID=A0A6H1ZB15_9ZZZZ
MRKLIINRILKHYCRGRDKGFKELLFSKDDPNESELKIVLEKMTDLELIKVLESQICQDCR